MDELASIFNNVARLVAIVGGGISTVALCYAGIMWMTASGDPQKMGQARMALMGAIGGLVIVGIAFIVPRIVSQAVIEPVGGVALGGEAGADCDQVLRNQLVFQRGASTEDNMNVVIAQIQAQRDECTSETWDPEVSDEDGTVTQPAGDPESCWAAVPAVPSGGSSPDWSDAELGDTEIPRSLHNENDETMAVRSTSGRDSNNNIIVYWSKADKRPTDDAKCWIYVSRLRIWDESY